MIPKSLYGATLKFELGFFLTALSIAVGEISVPSVSNPNFVI